MPRPDWLLILNGKSAGDDAVREAVQALRARGVALQVRVTWEDGDPERFVAEALERGGGHVIAGGGDGSLSEVAAHGSASGRERVGQDVSTTVGAVTFTKKKKNKTY